MNPHLEFLQRVVDSIRDRSLLKELNHIRRSRHTGLELLSESKSSVSLDKASVHNERIPVLRIHDYSSYVVRTVDYSLEGDEHSLRQRVVEILHHLIKVGKKLERLGFRQDGILSYSCGELEIQIGGDSIEIKSYSYLSRLRDTDFLNHWVRVLYNDSCVGVKAILHDSILFEETQSLLRKTVSIDMMTGLDKRIIDWIIKDRSMV